MLFNMATVSLVPPEEDRARNEDRGEGSGQNTDDEDERQIIDHTRTEDVERHRREQGRDTGEQGAREHAVNRQIDDRA